MIEPTSCPQIRNDDGAGTFRESRAGDCLIEVPLPSRAYQLIQELADEGVSLGEIVRRINTTGIMPTRGRLWGWHAVREVLLREQRSAANLHHHDAATRKRMSGGF